MSTLPPHWENTCLGEWSLSHSMEVDDGPSSDTEDLLSFVRMLDLFDRVVRRRMYVYCARLTESLRPAARHAIE